MNTIKINMLLQILSLILLSGLFWCCTNENVNDFPCTDGENAITFSIKVPGVATPKSLKANSRALTEGDENEVKEIAVLLFDNEGNYTFQPIYCGGSNITSNPENSQLKSFTIRVPEGTYDMVVLANSNNSLNSALSTNNKGQSKATVLSKLILSNSNKWNTTLGSGGYIAIPMWGEAKGVSISGSMPAKTTIKLVRMVAKIDVALSSTITKEKFNLQTVHLYNYNNQGQIVPDASKWDNSGSVVTASSVPSTANKLSTPLVYNGSAITSDTDSRGISCIDEIYTFEVAAGTASSLTTNTCLVVGGIYTGDSQVSYYRIDIANTISTGVSYLPLLRNHNYKVNIAAIKASGMSTAEAAFNSGPANIEVNIMDWNDAEISYITFDGLNMLGVSQESLAFTREAQSAASYFNTLSVTTDVPSGWKINKIIDSSGVKINWLDATIKSGTSGATTKTKLTMGENNTGSARTGYIHLSAERLSYIVKVEQLHTLSNGPVGNLNFIITDASGNLINELEFAAVKDVQPAQQVFTLNWPGTLPLSFSKTSGVKAFLFDTSVGYEQIPQNGTISSPIGTKTYTIRPPAIPSAELESNPFYERISTVRYSVSDGITSIVKNFALRQVSYKMIPVVDNIYRNDGKEKSFGIRSNTPFTVSIKSNPKNVMALRTTSGTANTTAAGTRIFIDLLTKVILPGSDVVVTIKSPTGLFPEQNITLNFEPDIIQPESNSYVVKQNGVTLVIPVSRANKSMLGNQLNANEAFTAELVWTDDDKKIDYRSNISSIDVQGTGPSGYLIVKSGQMSGNAVVAIKNSSGKILWSWHIWVTDYDPSASGTANFMNRNLGATNGSRGALEAKGLLYQWGRKDPFPGSSTKNQNDESFIYTATGFASVVKTAVAVNDNFGNSVANPLTFYYNAVTPYDWYSNGTNQNNDLWGGGITKTVYDPCPHGWHVPNADVWNGINSSNFPYTASEYGNYNNTYGGYYFVAGYRVSSTGGLSSSSLAGYCWSASINSDNSSKTSAKYLVFHRTSALISSSGERANGMSIRCVRD